MPQMSPLLWFNMFILFSITLMLLLSLLFFSKLTQQAPSSQTPALTNKLIWKW